MRPVKRIVLDTDPGVDDALAFMLAFASPELSVEAVTTVAGNVSQEKAHRNAKQLLEFLGRADVPVCAGAEKSLLRGARDASEFHGAAGLGGATLPEPAMATDPRSAARMITEKARELGRDLTLMAIGPLTNVAAAILGDPTLPTSVNGLIIMGGAFGLTPYGVGNANAVAEFNIWHDPEAARIVFGSGIPVVCAGLDTTTHPDYRMSPKMFEEITARGTERSRLIGDLCGGIVRRFNGFSLHDPMAIAYAVDPTIFRTEKHRVDVETAGELTLGMTVVDRRRFHRAQGDANAEIIVEADAARFHRLISERAAEG